jgi:hypothetical protein
MAKAKRVLFAMAGAVLVAVAVAAASAWARGQQSVMTEPLDEAGAYDEILAFTEGTGTSTL